MLIDCTLALPPHSAPEPDIIVTSAPRGDARQLVREYRVVSMPAAAVHLPWSPDGRLYRERRLVSFGEPLASATIDCLTVATDGLI